MLYKAFKKYLSNLRLKEKIMILILFILVLTSSASLISIKIVAVSSNKLLYKTLAGSLAYSANDISTKLSNIEAMSSAIISNKDIKKNLITLTDESDSIKLYNSRNSLDYLIIFNALITAIAFAALCAASLMLYSLILPTSSLNILKFANIVALLKTDDFFKEYCNLNIFGNPVGMLVVSLIFASILLIIVSIFAIVINGRIYDKPAAVPLYNITDKLSSFLSRKRPQLPLLLWEGLKILIHQKGIVFIAICFLIPLYRL